MAFALAAPFVFGEYPGFGCVLSGKFLRIYSIIGKMFILLLEPPLLHIPRVHDEANDTRDCKNKTPNGINDGSGEY